MPAPPLGGGSDAGAYYYYYNHVYDYLFSEPPNVGTVDGGNGAPSTATPPPSAVVDGNAVELPSGEIIVVPEPVEVGDGGSTVQVMGMGGVVADIAIGGGGVIDGPTGGVLLLVGPPSAAELLEATMNSVGVEVASQVIDISLSNGQSELGTTVEICLAVGDSEMRDSDDGCLGYIKVTGDGGSRWVCEDDCLKTRDDGGTKMLCGRTGHFTSFGVLFGGVAGDGGCGAADDNLITGSWIGDLVLAMGVAGLMCFCCTMLALLGAYNPTVRRFVRAEMSESQVRRMEEKIRQRDLERLSASSMSMDV